MIDLSKEPLVPVRPDLAKRNADQQRDALIKEGRTARRMWADIRDCPPFRDPDMRAWWRTGWIREVEDEISSLRRSGMPDKADRLQRRVNRIRKAFI